MRVAGPGVHAGPVTEQFDGPVVLTLVDQELRLQHVAFRFELLGQFRRNVVQRDLRFFNIAALLPDLGKEKPGTIADFRLDGVCEQTFKNLSRSQVMTIREIQPAE